MDSVHIRPQNLEERIVWYAITGTWVIYITGGLYVSGPVIAWVLFGILVVRWFFFGVTGHAGACRPAFTQILWCAGMLLMLVALIVGHAKGGFSVAATVKSSIGWAKGWALLALFPLVACLSIRSALIIQAVSLLCLQTLLLLPLLIVAPYIGLPEKLYLSPLSVVGGPGPEFFEVVLYGINPFDGKPRWRLFTPWGPALGMLANLYFLIVVFDRRPNRRNLAMLACVLMILISKSRLGLLALFLIGPAVWFVSQTTRGYVVALSGFVLSLASLFVMPIYQSFQSAVDQFHAARASSSEVRAALARLAISRWREEAPIWGHAVVERGPHLVEYMPIGSHHTWYGLLFVKGIVGLMSLAIPMAWTLIECLIKCQYSRIGKLGLGLFLVISAYTLGENLEILAYLFWPALLLLGNMMRLPWNARAAHQVLQPVQLAAG